MISSDQVSALRGSSVRGSDDERIGSVGEVYLNSATGEPVWASVRTGLFGLNETFVPLAGATFVDRVVHLPYDKEAVKASPSVAAVHDELGTDDQLALQLHYGSMTAAAPTAYGYADDQLAPSTVIVEEQVTEWYEAPVAESDEAWSNEGVPDEAVPGEFVAAEAVTGGVASAELVSDEAVPLADVPDVDASGEEPTSEPVAVIVEETVVVVAHQDNMVGEGAEAAPVNEPTESAPVDDDPDGPRIN
jgi:hypothetical protein